MTWIQADGRRCIDGLVLERLPTLWPALTIVVAHAAPNYDVFPYGVSVSVFAPRWSTSNHCLPRIQGWIVKITVFKIGAVFLAPNYQTVSCHRYGREIAPTVDIGRQELVVRS